VGVEDHSGWVNCGRWDYIFSFIRNLQETRACCCRTAAGDDDDAFYAEHSKLLHQDVSPRKVSAKVG